MEETIPELVDLLCEKDSRTGCRAMEELRRRSAETDGVYAHMDRFFELLDSKNSYVRTRALVLIAANARWDAARKIDGGIGRYLRHIVDPKPITSRQCVGLLPAIAWEKPGLRERIAAALEEADVSAYPDSMRPLVEGDIRRALDALERMG